MARVLLLHYSAYDHMIANLQRFGIVGLDCGHAGQSTVEEI
jgi:hypothetical protein